MSAGWLLAVDAGGTGCRLRALGPSGERVELAGPGVGVTAGGSTAGTAVLDLVVRFAQQTPGALAAGVDAIAAGVAGLVSLVKDPAALAAELASLTGARRCAVAADVLTAHLGALDGQPGAVIAAGTGSIALGTNFRDLWVRVDGWGHLLGDLGSGAWIGMEGLRAAAAQLDGRGEVGGQALGQAWAGTAGGGGVGVGQGCGEGAGGVRSGAKQDLSEAAPGGGGHGAPGAQLAAAAVARLGPVSTWPVQFYPAADRAGRLADFARDVASCAADGDLVARAIVRRAGAHLATTLAAAMAPGVPAHAAATGGVFKMGPCLSDAFRAEFSRLRPGADLVIGVGSPLDGSAHLARLVRDSAIAAHPPYLTVIAA